VRKVKEGGDSTQPSRSDDGGQDRLERQEGERGEGRTFLNLSVRTCPSYKHRGRAVSVWEGCEEEVVDGWEALLGSTIAKGKYSKEVASLQRVRLRPVGVD
jgi:hypothetical protein